MAEELNKVHSLDAARDWFLAHSEGSVICVLTGEDGSVKKEGACASFDEALAFYGHTQTPDPAPDPETPATPTSDTPAE